MLNRLLFFQPKETEERLQLIRVGESKVRVPYLADVKNCWKKLAQIVKEEGFLLGDAVTNGTFHMDHLIEIVAHSVSEFFPCLLYTSPSPRDRTRSRMPSSA